VFETAFEVISVVQFWKCRKYRKYRDIFMCLIFSKISWYIQTLLIVIPDGTLRPVDLRWKSSNNDTHFNL